MKILRSSFLALMLVLLTQCSKKTDEPLPNSPTDISIVGQIRSDNQQDADGFVVIRNEEYFNDNRAVYGGTYSGVFYTGSGASRISTSAGTLTIAGVYVPWLSANDPSKSQYQEYMGTNQMEMNTVKNSYGVNVPVVLSGNSSFPGFAANVYMPKKMSATCSNIIDGQLSKSNNLTLQWVPDNTDPNAKVFILLATDSPGNGQNPAAIVIETEDDGLYVLNSSVFQSFQVGGTAILHCGRGRSIITAQGQKQIEILSVVESKAGTLTVVQ
ncbi:MAG: hypothetical protein IT261_00305 [Saprospiraceae bacterium]|nr:hypothetical protein [Saprospiraceae bacterium]